MAALTTLITAQEVLYNTPRGQGTDVQNIAPFIPLKEETLFRVWLGLDWYAKLQADLVDHSAFTNYSESAAYAIGDVVLFRDMLYKAKAISTGKLPGQNGYWDFAPKFATDANQFLWLRYLRTVLAWHIMHTSLVYTAIKQTAVGVVQTGTEFGRVPSGRNMASLKAEVGQDLNDMLQTMDAYLKTNKATFPDYLPNKVAADCSGENSLKVGRPIEDYGFTCF